jgi:ATP-binding cassette subfamily B protein
VNEKNYSSVQLFGKLIGEARHSFGLIALLLLVHLLAIPLKLLMPVPLKVVVDNVLGSQPVPEILKTILPEVVLGSSASLLIGSAVILVLITSLVYVQVLGVWLMQTYVGQKLVIRFRSKLFRHVQKLSLAYHDRKGVADSIYHIQYDAPSIQWVALDGVIHFITACITIIGMIVVIAALDLTLAVIAMIVVPNLFVLTQVCGKRLRQMWSEVKRVESSAISVLQETLSSIRVVKAFGQEDKQYRQYLEESASGMRGQMRVAKVRGSFDLVVGLTTAVGTALVLYFGVKHVIAGSLTLGELLIVMTYLSQLYTPLETISKKVADLQSGMASAQRVFSLLDRQPEVTEIKNPVRVDRVYGRLRFQKMSFGYDPSSMVLRDVNIVIPAGRCVGVFGKTGAGKSTLVSLLMRFYDPVKGRIILDGLDLRDYSLSDLRKQFGMVLQDPVLFSTSIAENIAYAKPDASMPEIIEASKAANANEFIEAMPEGYETQVGERGMLLSGGERQRISLARAFLKDAPILILDEPTSSVDVRTEAAIMDATQRLIRGRTSIMIAHRSSTLAGCDLLLNIEDGYVTKVKRRKARSIFDLQAAGGLS